MSEVFKFDGFLSHNWGKNASNHDRVAYINDQLKKGGVETWFDEVQMAGDIDIDMSDAGGRFR